MEHGLTRMWTLTLRRATTAEDRPLVVRLFQRFSRLVRARLPALKWLAVLEWHPGGHGWHIHMVVDRFVPKAVMAEMWLHGFVDGRRIAVRGDSTSAAATRKASAYVAKYVSKPAPEGAPAHVPGDHRYLRPLGMSWTEVEAEGDFATLVELAWRYWGTPITWMWWSGDDDTWRGPKVLCLRPG